MLKYYLLFCLCYPIFLNNVFDGMIFLVNNYCMFTFYYINVEGVLCCYLLVVVFKESVKFL